MQHAPIAAEIDERAERLAADLATQHSAGLKRIGYGRAATRTTSPAVSESGGLTIDAAGTRLVGTWSQRSLSLPLTFARDAK